MKSVALISHRFGNIGHTFMAIGVEEIVRKTFGPDTRIVHFEQHKFFDLFPWYHPLRLLDFIPHGRLSGLRWHLGTESSCDKLWSRCRHLREFDIAINCGGPSVSPGVGSSAEMRLMFLFKLGAFKLNGVPTIDLGVGSGAFPIEKTVGNARQVFSPIDIEYFERLFKIADLTTTRDEVARRLLAELGRPTSLIPCAAFLSGQYFSKLDSANSSRELILINFQKYGANEDWGQGVSPEKWASTVKDLIERLKKRHKIAFICHSKAEMLAAEKLETGIPCYFPKNPQDYGHLIKRAKAGLVSRIHSAIPLAGIGIPSITIGTDTRLGTIEQLGLPTRYVKEATADFLESTIEQLIMNGSAEQDRLLKLREETLEQYVKILKGLSAPQKYE